MSSSLGVSIHIPNQLAVTLTPFRRTALTADNQMIPANQSHVSKLVNRHKRGINPQRSIVKSNWSSCF
jgi:hypothetical protein